MTTAEVAAEFGRALRGSGIDAPPASVHCFARALGELGLGSAASVYWAGHASFVRRPEDSSTYAAAFADFFAPATRRSMEATDRTASAPPADDGVPAPDRHGGEGGDIADVDRRIEGLEQGEESPGVEHVERAEETDDVEDAGSPPGSAPPIVIRYSALELLRRKDLAVCTEAELQELERLTRVMLHHPPRRRSRRTLPGMRPHGPPDIRRTLRTSFRTAGEAVELRRLGPRPAERALVLLIDVSGSMDSYSRAFLHFAHATVSVRRRVEVFALGTRLTRITRSLQWRDTDGALRAAIASVEDMSGGTRLGDGLARFNERHAVAGMARGAVVVIFSDGWDRGDPGQIGREMERLSRVAHRILWVNPLKAAPDYAPLAQGMAAALPHLDDFLDGHSLASLERLAGAMAA